MDLQIWLSIKTTSLTLPPSIFSVQEVNNNKVLLTSSSRCNWTKIRAKDALGLLSRKRQQSRKNLSKKYHLRKVRQLRQLVDKSHLKSKLASLMDLTTHMNFNAELKTKLNSNCIGVRILKLQSPQMIWSKIRLAHVAKVTVYNNLTTFKRVRNCN